MPWLHSAPVTDAHRVLADPVIVSEADEVTDELVEAFVRLIPQLSSSSPPTSRAELEEIVGSEAGTLFVARDA